MPIIVVVGNGHAHPVAHALEPRFFRNILERPIRLLVVHAVPVLRRTLLRNKARRRGIRVWRAIDEKQVEPPIIIAIKQRYS